MIVPFEHLGELLAIYDEEFRARGLDAAVWGHISDGNLHPNVIPRSIDEVESGKAAILTFGREVIRLGGSPLAEHGVGRNPVKQQLLLELYGREGVARCARSSEPWTRTSSSRRAYSSESDEALPLWTSRCVIAAAPAVADVCRLDCAREPRQRHALGPPCRVTIAPARLLRTAVGRLPSRRSHPRAVIGPRASTLSGSILSHRLEASHDSDRSHVARDLQVCPVDPAHAFIVSCVAVDLFFSSHAFARRTSLAVDADVRRRAVRDRQPPGRAAGRRRVHLHQLVDGDGEPPARARVS